jgi:hypothetical protein
MVTSCADEFHILAIRGQTLALLHSRIQRNELRRLMKARPALLSHEWFLEVAGAARRGTLSLY